MVQLFTVYNLWDNPISCTVPTFTTTGGGCTSTTSVILPPWWDIETYHRQRWARYGQFSRSATKTRKKNPQLQVCGHVWTDSRLTEDTSPYFQHTHVPLRGPVTDILLWIESYSTMVAVLASRFPVKVPQLMTYQKTSWCSSYHLKTRRWVNTVHI